MKGINYQHAGVNIELGNDASKILYNASKLTWKNRKGKIGDVEELFKDFSGLRAVAVGKLPKDAYIGINFDGVGTKIELGERIAKHDTVAYDLFAMVCDDAVVRGAEPALIGSILDVRSLGDDHESYINFIQQLAKGYVGAANEAGVAVINGEMAELGARVSGYGPFNYNWGAGVVWFASKKRMLTGYEIKKGDTLVGLREDGFRSNGLSLLRKVMEGVHGKEWHKDNYKGKSLAKIALHPSRIYTKAVVDMFGGFDGIPQAKVHGVAHITGGGIPEKLGRILKPSRLGADIEDPFKPCELMLYCQEHGNIPDDEAYRTWNMGQGMIIVTPEPDIVIQLARRRKIIAKVIGKVAKPGIRLHNKGFFSDTTPILKF